MYRAAAACIVLLVSCEAFLLDDTPSSLDVSDLQFTYFDLRARGEITRLLFAAAKKPLNEVRVQFADWPTLKPTMPFGQLPVLNISGTEYAQSLAIQAFIAKEFGLYPTNNRDALMTDQIANAREDLFIAESRVFGPGQTPTAQVNTTLTNAYPIYFNNFNNFIKENPSQSGFVIGDKMTMADIIIFEGTQTAVQQFPNILDNYPEIKKLRAKVVTQDGIKQYIAKRPYSQI